MRRYPTLKLSKTDAAKRQLETAVRLWFFSQDPVSVHTLAAAAHQILHDIGKAQGIETILRGASGVRPEYKKEYRRIVSSYENFFKHADKDASALLDFNPETTEIFLFDAVLTYETLTKEISPVLSALKTWMFIKRPNLINEKDRDKLVPMLAQSQLATLTKADFFTQWQTVSLRSGIAT